MVSWAFGHRRYQIGCRAHYSDQETACQVLRIALRRISVTKLSFDRSISTIVLLFHAVSKPYNQHRRRAKASLRVPIFHSDRMPQQGVVAHGKANRSPIRSIHGRNGAAAAIFTVRGLWHYRYGLLYLWLRLDLPG